jgi:hypothetical protein
MMLEFLLEIVKADLNFLQYFNRDIWAILIESVFRHKHCTMFHNMVLKLLLQIFSYRNESLMINVIICQNPIPSMVPIYETYLNHLIYGMEFDDHDLLQFMNLLSDFLLSQFDRNAKFPQLSYQLKSSYSWQKVKQLKKDIAKQ